jgi:hypothetical protein
MSSVGVVIGSNVNAAMSTPTPKAPFRSVTVLGHHVLRHDAVRPPFLAQLTYHSHEAVVLCLPFRLLNCRLTTWHLGLPFTGYR